MPVSLKFAKFVKIPLQKTDFEAYKDLPQHDWP